MVIKAGVKDASNFLELFMYYIDYNRILPEDIPVKLIPGRNVLNVIFGLLVDMHLFE